MDFSWLSSDGGNFAWMFSTITESYKPEANIWWNDESKAMLSNSISHKWCKIMLVNSFSQAYATEIFKIHKYATAILQRLL